jgi:hypothetical protein
VAGVQWLGTIARSGGGLGPLARRRLSPLPSSQEGPEPTRLTAALFRVLVLLRWLRRSNFAGRRLAAWYLARADAEVRGAGARPRSPRPIQVLEAGNTTPDGVRRHLRHAAEPLVIRGLHTLQRDWSLAALVESFGSTRVLFNEDYGYRLRPLRDLLRGNAGDPYVANCEQLLVRHPELLDDLALEAYRPWTGGRPYCAQLFLGSRRSLGLYFHCANNFNAFTMLHGRKRWTFVHPAFSYWMYPIVSRHSAYVASIIHHVEAPPGADDLFRYCPRYEVVLEPGDVLLNPPWWWHQVENLDDETVGCASRWIGTGVPDTNPLFSFAQTSSWSLLRTSAQTAASLLESGGDLAEHYRRLGAAESPVTPIENVSHTAEAQERGCRFDAMYPRPPALLARMSRAGDDVHRAGRVDAA